MIKERKQKDSLDSPTYLSFLSADSDPSLIPAQSPSTKSGKIPYIAHMDLVYKIKSGQIFHFFAMSMIDSAYTLLRV
ncbi:hypothetical protein AX774_g6972 [Zancudomyces culisetae]|uniref:Uncharacterized protein n=1 Tax=Zancudomyces culisetae TaxID=1213189 RepID=A0A1R1PF32_ZANCU|nr:hypothetical protein AX774_g6972 [Zancudomyces culisetae]|eukprot:OMH79610.1 hypothetical protein AX774_g6972 [Zancudomyces culisetae]